MCWSGEASAVLAAIGISSSAYMALKNDPEPLPLWISLLYFSSMEALQSLSYTVVNQCESQLNQTLTIIAFLHIVFQPFFINAIAMYFMPIGAVKIIAPWAYFLCFISALSMILQLYPFEWAGHCAIGSRPLCGNILCTIRGEWHIAWLIPSNGIGNIFAGNFIFAYGWLGYSNAAFVLPFIIGSWRFAIFTLIFGPLLALFTTNNINEWPAIWCLYSIALCMAIIKTPLRAHLFVGNPLWYRAYLHLKKY